MTNSLPTRSGKPIYVVDDQKMIARTLSLILEHNGYQARWFSEAYVLLDASVECPPALVVSDVMMPGMTGIELASELRLLQPECKILLFSGQANTEELSTEACHEYEVLAKPVSPDILLGRVAQLMSSQGTRADVPSLPIGGRRHSDTEDIWGA